MVAHSTLTPKTERYPLPPDGPLMARLRVADALRLALGGGSEDGDQRKLKHLLNTKGVLWEHTANEGIRNKTERGSVLARGLKKGSPDIKVYQPFTHEGITYAGMAIELKRNDATPTQVEDEQRQWLTRLRECGWMAEWCRGFIEASKLIVAAYGQAAAKGGR